jgi:BTB/POZ domain-containing protein KCTD9
VRLSYEASCRRLQERGYLDAGNAPPLLQRRPRFDDEEPRVSFFRTFVGEGDLEDLTLPCTFFGRSQVGPISFARSDLSRSTMCWNDFTSVDFTECDLSGSDLRAAVFDRVKFTRANLRDADLRGSSFSNCDFTDADMTAAKLTRKQGKALILSQSQRDQIEWCWVDGEEPGGG